ncbi:ABC transporter permease [Nonomuraea sp. B12E4]|uniref:ABC transporter permease n=1 Tax=Nonomuraea sp. B12E4 TaxID=3153564 RepID=UPI00325C6816
MIGKSLLESRRALIWWCVGISAFMSVYLGAYATVKQNPETYGAAALDKFPGPLRDLMGGLQDFTSGTGYLQGVAYQLFAPMLLIACAMLLANRAIAQPEESGTLELIVTLPVDRRRLVLDRLAALAVGLLVVAGVTLVVTWVVSEGVGTNAPFDRILAAHTGVFLIALLYGTAALAVGAATGRRMVASAGVGAWVVASYVVVSLGSGVEAIAWLKWISPFHYYAEGRPLFEGLPVGDYLVLAGATAVLALTAVLAFDRRDVGV